MTGEPTETIDLRYWELMDFGMTGSLFGTTKALCMWMTVVYLDLFVVPLAVGSRHAPSIGTAFWNLFPMLG